MEDRKRRVVVSIKGLLLVAEIIRDAKPVFDLCILGPNPPFTTAHNVLPEGMARGDTFWIPNTIHYEDPAPEVEPRPYPKGESQIVGDKTLLQPVTSEEEGKDGPADNEVAEGSDPDAGPDGSANARRGRK